MDESLLDAFFVPVEGMQSEQCGDELILFDSASKNLFPLVLAGGHDHDGGRTASERVVDATCAVSRSAGHARPA